ncbi:MAG: ABC transporter ATP-binding protein [Ruminococcus sp.]
MFKLRRFLKDYKLQLIIGPACKLFEAILELCVPLVMASIIDEGIQKNDMNHIIVMGVVLVLLGVVGLGSALVCQYMASYTSQGAGTKIRTALLAHINGLSHKELDSIGTPSLITRMTGDINAVQANIAMTMRLLLRAPFLIIGALIMACFIDLKLSVIFFCGSFLIAVVLYLVMTKSLPFYKQIQKLIDKVSLISRENLSGNRVIRAFSKQKSQQESLDNAGEELSKTTLRVSRLSALLNPATYVITYSAIILILWFGGGQVNNGALMSGDVIALTSYMTQILLAMIVLANLVVLLSKGIASAGRINQIFEINSSVTEKSQDKIVPVKTAPAVEFDNVSFTYGDGDNELNNISFSIEKNSVTGIIGTTGAGKTTLINLILRFYDATEGVVKFNGTDVKDYPFSQLRGDIGVVLQKSVLVSGTVRSNMKWQKPDATDEEIWKALEIAQAKDFVNDLPRKLDAPVNQEGTNFSGGQRQRLCIARALVGSPATVILDDSFSALDFATEKALREQLLSLKDTTLIIVTQRCASIMNADKIIVLEDGETAGQGTHKELLKSCDTYREICLSQLKESEVEL